VSLAAGTPTTPGERLAGGFVGLLRGVGITVPVSRLITFVESLAMVGVSDRDSVYWAGRSTLLDDRQDLDLYDSAFAVFWEQRDSGSQPSVLPEAPPVLMATDEAGGFEDDEDPDGEEGQLVQVRYSATEVLRNTDFASCSPEELAELHALMADLKFTSRTRPSHRLVADRKGRQIDLRRTLRAAMTTGGEAVVLARRRRARRQRRLILLVDVSGSMESYARALLRFANAAVAGRARVEAFTIGTRLTRVTRELASRDPDAAMMAASESVRDWSGGTRLGAMIREFNDDWGVRGLARGAVVVVLSDGWDRGDPAELAEQMERLHRVTHKLIWVNPLKHTPGYVPLARGMAAALPHVDTFVEGHAFASLERLVSLISSDRESARIPISSSP